MLTQLFHWNLCYLAVFILISLDQSYFRNENENENYYKRNKKAVLPQGNRAMLQVFFSVEVRQQHSLQV